jgi:hypothetical protein
MGSNVAKHLPQNSNNSILGSNQTAQSKANPDVRATLNPKSIAKLHEIALLVAVSEADS